MFLDFRRVVMMYLEPSCFESEMAEGGEVGKEVRYFRVFDNFLLIYTNERKLQCK